MLVRFARHSAWLLLARLWTQAAIAVFTILAARKLGGNGFGEYAFLAALIVTGNLLTTFGTDLFLIRIIAASGRIEQLPAALVLQLLLSSLFVAGIYLVSPLFTFLSAEGELAVRLYSLSLFPLAFLTVFSTALRGTQAMGAYAVLSWFLASMQVLTAGLFYRMGGGLATLAGLLLLVQTGGALAAGILCTIKIPNFWRAWHFSWNGVSFLARACTSLALLSATGILYQRLAPVLLPFLLGAFPAGIYAAAARMVEMAKVGHIAAFTALYPLMAQNKADKRGRLRSYQLPWLALLSAAGLGSLGLFLFARILMNDLMGIEYAASIPVLKILSWTLLPYTASTFLSLAFLALNDVRAVTVALATALLVQAALIIWWGSSGPLGVAGAVLVSEILQTAILSFRAARQYHWPWLFPGGRANELPDLS